MNEPNEEQSRGRRSIVSSAHLADGTMPALSEMEFSLTLAVTAYQRWMVRCMAAAGMPQLSPNEVLIVHTVRHRDRPKTLADIALVLDIEETHLVTYALRKLERLGLVRTVRRGKEKLVAITAEGIEICAKYRSLREDLLIRSIKSSAAPTDEITSLAVALRTLSGFYNQAARAAATI